MARPVVLVYGVGMDTRTCSDCKETLPLTAFTKSGRYWRSYCRSCSNRRCSEYAVGNREKRNERLRRWRAENPEAARAVDQRKRLRQNYGLTVAEVEEMTAAQGGRCAICTVETSLVVDHCHQSGAVRQMLCRSCNTFLGRVEANPKILEAMHSYLLLHRVG